jgi:hypothetical protein
MSELQDAKALVAHHHAVLDAAAPGAATCAALADATAPDWAWHGYHPFGLLTGADAVSERFWSPLKRAMTALHRRADIFLAGRNDIDGGASVWVAEMGHLVGLFDAPWLGIPPSRKMAFLRYATSHRVAGGRIAQTALYFDIPQMMMQAGLRPFPPQTGAHLVQPGPATHDGLLRAPQPEEEGGRTLRLINAMIRDIGTWNSGLPLEEELRRSWHEDMAWWGPAGIGATFTIPRYAEQHARPFRAGFADRARTGHVARIAEGRYGGFFGWPNFTARPTGGFMGMPATQKAGEFRVIDMYRRDGDRLAENWVFIDLLHFWDQQGVDILARTVSEAGA